MKKQYKALTAITLSTGLTLSLTSPVFAYEKDETVYVTLQENGTVKTITVGDHLKADGEEKMNDASDLKDIKNVNGDETFTQDGHSLVWDNQGKDIYYEGTTEKTLPIKTTITYKLDGKEMTPQQMVGKKGHVEITIHMTNTDKHDDLYTPFVVTFASMIPETNHHHIEITNGKVMANGKTNVLVGIAAPGLYESLDEPEALKDMDTITIQYDTDAFETLPMYALATPKLLDEADLDLDGKINDVSSKLNTLQDASTKLVQGTGELANGSHELNTNYQQFDAGLAKLLAGTSTLKNQYQTLDQGIQALAKESSNLSQVSGMLGKLNELGSATVALDEGIQTLKQAVATSTDPNSDVNQKLAALKQDLATKQEELIALQTQMGGLQNELKTRVGAFMQLSGQLGAAIEKESNPEQVVALTTIKGGLDDQIQQLTQNLTALSNGMTLLHGKLEVMAQDMNALNELSTQMSTNVIEGLNTAITQFGAGNDQLKQGFTLLQQQTAHLPEKINQLVAGTSQLSEGSTKVIAALSTMNSSTDTLYQANTKINKAIGLIANGALTLQTGMTQFDQEGIQNLSSLSQILEDAGDKADRLIQLSKDYKTFTKVEKNIDSDIKFIYTIQYESTKDKQ